MPDSLPGTLRSLRTSRRLTQQQVAEAGGLSPETVRSYESGRRTPDRETLGRLADAMQLLPRERRELFAAAGDDSAASPRLEPIRQRRARVKGTEQELARYEWPTLITNERHEVWGWNNLANAVAEADLGALLPTAFERSLLWMASLEHFERRLMNWDELIGRLVTILRIEGVTLDRGGPPPPYLQALITRVAAERPRMIDRFYKLWLAPDTWQDGMRNLHPIAWRLSDGTELSFVGAFRDWSAFDGSLTFDWIPADPSTGRWTEQASSSVGRGGSAPAVTEVEDKTFPQLLQEARDAAAMTRPELAGAAAVSVDALYAYERGRRLPRRDAVLAVARALSLDGFSTNVWLDVLGYAQEPSDFARVITGLETVGIMQGHVPIRGATEAARRAELMTTAWPCFMLNSRCEIEGANSAAARLVALSQVAAGAVGERVHLLEFMVSRYCRERMQNWAEVARAVLPDSLRIFVLGYRGEKPETALVDRIREIRRKDDSGLRDLLAAWDSAEEGPAPQRIAVPIEWLDDHGTVLRFHCFVTAWNGYDPCWAIDWHPANGAAWEVVESHALMPR